MAETEREHHYTSLPSWINVGRENCRRNYCVAKCTNREIKRHYVRWSYHGKTKGIRNLEFLGFRDCKIIVMRFTLNCEDKFPSPRRNGVLGEDAGDVFSRSVIANRKLFLNKPRVARSLSFKNSSRRRTIVENLNRTRNILHNATSN